MHPYVAYVLAADRMDRYQREAELARRARTHKRGRAEVEPDVTTGPARSRIGRPVGCAV